MSLPKRDGVNGRYYLIHKPDADAFSQLVLDEQFAGGRGKRSKACLLYTSTPILLKDYQQKDPRISAFQTNGRGPAEARNRGMRECKGKYLYFMDADLSLIHI